VHPREAARKRYATVKEAFLLLPRPVPRQPYLQPTQCQFKKRGIEMISNFGINAENRQVLIGVRGGSIIADTSSLEDIGELSLNGKGQLIAVYKVV
jgi:hypothetical protein